MPTLRSISYVTTNTPAISGHTRSKVAHIVGGTVGGAVGLIIIAAVLFLLCQRHRADSDTSIIEKPENEKEPSTLESSKSQVAIRKIDDLDRKLDNGTLPTTQKGSGFGGVLSLSAPVQAGNASDVRPISESDGDKIPRMTASLSQEARFCASPDQHVSEAPIPFAIHNPSNDGCKELVLSSPTGGEAPLWSRSSHASQMDMIATSPPEHPFGAATDADASPHAMMEMSSDLDGHDVELLSTYAMESHPTASESIFHPDTALVPTPTVQQLNDWTEASKVVFSIDIGTSHSVGFLLLKSMTTFLP
jgi:hypothetical protein